MFQLFVARSASVEYNSLKFLQYDVDGQKILIPECRFKLFNKIAVSLKSGSCIFDAIEPKQTKEVAESNFEISLDKLIIRWAKLQEQASEEQVANFYFEIGELIIRWAKSQQEENRIEGSMALPPQPFWSKQQERNGEIILKGFKFGFAKEQQEENGELILKKFKLGFAKEHEENGFHLELDGLVFRWSKGGETLYVRCINTEKGIIFIPSRNIESFENFQRQIAKGKAIAE